MPVKLSTTVSNIQTIPNEINQVLVKQFYEFMKSSGTSDKYQNNNLKTITAFGKFLEPALSFQSINKRDQIIAFLDTKIKNSHIDPDKRWITTWNDYLGRLKYFFRWLHNTRNPGRFIEDNSNNEETYIPIKEWKTPLFLRIDKKKTKRLSPYLETELWEKEDILTIVKYDIYKRNKAALTLLWDLDARPHEVTLLKIKHIRLKEKYGAFTPLLSEITIKTKSSNFSILLPNTE